MEKINKYRLPILTSILLIVGSVFYSLLIRPEVINAVQGNPSYAMRFLLNTFYPRFFIEQNRFNAEFFLAKADMVLYRCTGVILLISFIPVILKNEKQKEKLEQFLRASSSKKTFYVVSITLLILHLLIIHEIYTSLLDRIPLADFYKARWINRLISSEYPSRTVIHILSMCWIISLSLFFIKRTRTLSGIISLFFFIWMQGYYFGFEKIDHSFYTFFLVILLLPFYYHENKDAFIEKSWSLRWMQILIACVYAFSALEKLTTSGLQWLNAYNLQVHLLQHQMKPGLWIAQYDALCSLMLFGAFLIQISFFIGLFKRSWMRWICLGGFIFHMSTYFLMGIGHWLNPWFVVYVVFLTPAPKK